MKAKIAIVGAGMSGLTVANTLKDIADIDVFEKSRGVGGRMATRRAAPYAFDHGAAFFQAKSAGFKSFISPMIEVGVITPWSARLKKSSENQRALVNLPTEVFPCFVGNPGMSAIAKYLSSGISLNISKQITSLSANQGKWVLKTTEDVFDSYDWVIFSMPPEQTKALLPTDVSIDAKLLDTVMNPCFSLMLGFEDPPNIDFDIATIQSPAIDRIVINHNKPGRNKAFSLLIQSTRAWALAHINDEPDNIIAKLSSLGSQLIGHDLNHATHQALHRWRFADTQNKNNSSYFVDTDKKIGICGDWFVGSQIEDAFTSGEALSKVVAKNLN